MKRKLRSMLLLMIMFTLATTGVIVTDTNGKVNSASGFREEIRISNVVIQEDGTITGQLHNKRANAANGIFVAALYNKNNKMIDMTQESMAWDSMEMKTFTTRFATTLNPSEHAIRLFVWNSLQQKKPLSKAVDVNPYGLKEVTTNFVNPYSFYVGRVARSIGDSDSTTSVDLTKYIDESNKTINSITGQLNWNYDKGIAKVNTPLTQGATGHMNSQSVVELDQVAITFHNDFGTVMVISMDNKPISSSRKLMIQAMTQEKPYGFTTIDKANGVKEITSMGDGPLNVENINASVLLKGITDVTGVYALDMNGYVSDTLTGTVKESGYEIKLNPDSLYTVVERSGGANPHQPGESLPKEEEVFVWWEGEDAIETNFEQPNEFSASTIPDTRHQLSGVNNDWLTQGFIQVDPEDPPYAKYEIDVPETAAYSFYARKFWNHGPYQWRFDGGEWHSVGRNNTLLDSVTLRRFLEVNWINTGTVTLAKGKHTFELKLTAESDQSLAAFDAFLLTKQSFIPSGELKPGEKLNRAEEGWWSVEPDVDPFSDKALMDLRYLNEAYAGANGFVRKQDDKFVLGNGKEQKFWAVNVGSNAIQLGKSDVDYMARKLAKNGVNLVRIHGIIFDEDGNIPQEDLDKYLYYVAALKKEGIYVTLSYYFVLWWDMREAAAFQGPEDEFFEWNKQPFGLIQFNEKQQELYKKGLRKLMTTPNPYDNGLTLAQNPSVATVEIQNEDSFLFWTFEDYKYPANVKNDLYKQFGQYLIHKYGSLDAAYDAWGPLKQAWNDTPEKGLMQVGGIGALVGAVGEDSDAKRKRDILRFLTETQKSFYEKMSKFIKNDLNSKSLVSASNWITADPQKLEALERYTYTATDVMDRHAYFEADHTTPSGMTWTVQAGDSFKPSSTSQNPGKNPVKAVHNDKQPTMISEISWSNPTPYGAEGPYFMAVYGALQGIDAIHSFAMGNPAWSAKMDKWPISTPSQLGQYPAFALMYRRGDVNESKNVVYETSTLQSLYQLKGTKIYESLNLDDSRK